MATVFHQSDFASGASDKYLIHGPKRPSVEMRGGLERAEHFVLESREGAEPGVLMPLSEWPAGGPQKAVTPPNSQPQGMVLARGRRGGVRWVLEPCGPVSC